VEEQAAYTFFWSGRPDEDRREAGVAFAIKTNMVKNLSSPPREVSNRLISV
jgi:hypothetical protein